MKQFRMVGIVLTLLLVNYATNTPAATIMFTDRSAWETAVAGSGYGVNNIDFENTSSSADHFTITADDVAFSSPGVWLEVTDSPIGYDSGKSLYLTHNQPIQVSMPGGVYAFGFDLGEYEFPNAPVPTLGDVILSTGDTFPGPYEGSSYPVYAFFGFLSDGPIDSVAMHPHALVEPFIDNFSYAQIPEPGTMILIGCGLMGLAGYWRRRFMK